MSEDSGKSLKDGKNPKDGDSSSKSASSFRPGASRPIISGAKFDVEKFDGKSNFGMWQCEVMDVLIQHELDFALGDKPDNCDEQEWDRINRQTCGFIRLCLAKDQKYFVMRETKAKDLWKRLEDKFMTKSVENRLYLKKKLFRFQYRAGSSLSEHLNDFSKILADLRNLDASILDEDKALLLLNSLPSTYDHLSTTLLYGKEEIRYEDVCNALTNNEYRMRDKQTHQDTSDQALVVGKNTRPQSSKVPPFAKPMGVAIDECAYCHNKGHWKRDCPILKNKDTKSNYASDRDDDLGISLVSHMTVSHSMESQWILDSGCSYHTCPNRDWFSDLKPFEGGDVLVGNGHTCKTLGIGTIRLVMHDGLVWTLENVRYVPDVKFNLISLGTLESDGLVIILKNETLKVCMGNLVVMEGVRRKKLYFLEGSIVLGGAATGATVIGESDLDTTALVHECSDEDLEKQLGVGFGEHCVLGRQLGVKFGMAVDHFFEKLDFVWGSAFDLVVSLGGTYQFGLLVSCSCCYWIYHLDFVYGYLLLVEIDRLKTNLGFNMELGHWFWILGTADLETLVYGVEFEDSDSIHLALV